MRSLSPARKSHTVESNRFALSYAAVTFAIRARNTCGNLCQNAICIYEMFAIKEANKIMNDLFGF